MENPEEVLQALDQFQKLRPSEIPRELEEYLCWVAKTGDPVYQWGAIKVLFREKLTRVMTEFYENCPSLDLTPCPNVEQFNYDTMKNNLLDQLESFANAPFTVQRICELLTSPRKEYNRIDKFMRAIEKNILVVSTREPGPVGRRSENGEGLVNGSIENESVNNQDSNEIEMEPWTKDCTNAASALINANENDLMNVENSLNSPDKNTFMKQESIINQERINLEHTITPVDTAVPDFVSSSGEFLTNTTLYPQVPVQDSVVQNLISMNNQEHESVTDTIINQDNIQNNLNFDTDKIKNIENKEELQQLQTLFQLDEELKTDTTDKTRKTFEECIPIIHNEDSSKSSDESIYTLETVNVDTNVDDSPTDSPKMDSDHANAENDLKLNERDPLAEDSMFNSDNLENASTSPKSIKPNDETVNTVQDLLKDSSNNIETVEKESNLEISEDLADVVKTEDTKTEFIECTENVKVNTEDTSIEKTEIVTEQYNILIEEAIEEEKLIKSVILNQNSIAEESEDKKTEKEDQSSTMEEKKDLESVIKNRESSVSVIESTGDVNNIISSCVKNGLSELSNESCDENLKNSNEDKLTENIESITPDCEETCKIKSVNESMDVDNQEIPTSLQEDEPMEQEPTEVTNS